MKQLSLILNVCNSNKEYLEKTVNSVKNQTLPKSKFEIIVYDDGSKDDTLNFTKDLFYEMQNVSFHGNKNNYGLASARNRAIDKSKGKYISLLDDDDVLPEKALESTLKFLNENPKVKYAYSKHKRIDFNDNFIVDRVSKEYDKNKILHYNFISPLKTFSKEVHKKIGGFSENILYAQDWDHILKADFILNEGEIKRIPEFLYLYRIHPNSISTTKNEKRKEFICDFLAQHLKKRGIDANVFWSHKGPDLYNYFNWEIK